MEFQGFVKLDRHLVETLGPFLEEKEAEFGQIIIKSIDNQQYENNPAPTPPTEGYHIKLFEAVEIFGKRIKESASRGDHVDWRQAAKEINEAGWHYLEFLEGCSVELFKQLRSVGLTQWDNELFQSVESIKIRLQHHLEDLKWALKRLENQLWKFRWDNERRLGRSVWLQKIISFGETILDKTLFYDIEKTEKYLAFQYMKFANRYGEYLNIQTKAQENAPKLDEFQGLDLLEPEERLKYKKLHDFLKFWVINQRAKAIPKAEVAATLDALMSPEKAKKTFKEYAQILNEKLFDYSRNLKQEKQDGVEVAKKYAEESLSLAATIANYREFLLRTDPNPYVRARWGFSEWIVGPESRQTKELLDLSYSVESLKRRFETLVANDREPTVNFDKAKNEINRLIHGMSQPLISRETTKSVAEKVLSQMEKLDELGATNPAVVDLIGQSLNKLLKVDWKYNVLFDIPSFHEIYNTHCSIAGHAGDERQHINRLNKLKRMTRQILGWVTAGTANHHSQEFDHDMIDIKGCLQDFLAYIQRIGQEKKINSEQLQSWISTMERELLELRYLFGKFFHDLQLIEPDERMTRSKFLFVDRYFEAIEHHLSAIKQRPFSDNEHEGEMPAEGKDEND